MGVPSETLSPTFTRNFSTTPAWGLGMSMAALSDSTVRRGAFLATVSPGFTRMSMTATSLKPPMSGIWISMGWVILKCVKGEG